MTIYTNLTHMVPFHNMNLCDSDSDILLSHICVRSFNRQYDALIQLT